MVSSPPPPYDGIDPAWAERQRAAFRALSPSPPPDSFPAFLFGRLLEGDLRESCRPALPENVGSLHGVTIEGTCILQIVDVVNIGANFEHRTEDTRGPTRTLKLCFTDGHQLVFGFEFQWLPQFSVQTPRGSKVAMQNVNVRHGMLMLTPQNCQLLEASAELAAQSQKQPLSDSQDNSKPSGVYAAALTTAQFGSASGLMSTTTDPSSEVTSPDRTSGVVVSTTTVTTGSSAARPQAAAGATNANTGQTPATPAPNQRAPQSNAAQVQHSRTPPPPVFVDVISSDDDCESDKTDPMVEHLFYSPNTPRHPTTTPREPASSMPSARKRPHSAIGAVAIGAVAIGAERTQKVSRPPPTNNTVVIDDQEAAVGTSSTSASAFSRRPPLPVVDPSQPFQYFSSKQSFPHLSALQPLSRAQPQMVEVRAFIKSVAGFQFQTGEYQLRVLVEDCSQVRQVDVAPAFVASLMGVSCAEFTRAMQQTPAIAHRWAARMQFALMTLEGVMSFRVDRRGTGADAAEVLTLMNVHDVTRDGADKLLARVAQSVRSGR